MANPMLVDRTDATAKQMLVYLLDRIDLIDQTLNRMENKMTDLTASVEALKGAVDGVAQRTLIQVNSLEASLASAREALVVALSDDAKAAALFAEVEAATAALRTETDRLNFLGADPSTPVDPEAPNADQIPEAPLETSAPVVSPELPVDSTPDAAPVDASAPIEAPVDTPAPVPAEAPVDTPVPPSAPTAATPTPDESPDIVA